MGEIIQPFLFLKRYPFLTVTFSILIFIFCKLPYITLPYYWDELGVYANASLYMYENGLSLLPGSLPVELSRGHPMLFIFLSGLNFKIFGTSVITGHTFILIISIFLIIMTYIFAKKYFNAYVGICASILLILQPVFLAQSTLILPEVFLALLILSAIYFYLDKKYILYFILAGAAQLTKESGIFLVLALIIGEVIYYFVNEKKSKKWAALFNKLLIVVSPAILAILFFLIQKIKFGWVFFPYHTDGFGIDYNILIGSMQKYFQFLLIDQMRYLLTGIILIYFIIRSLQNHNYFFTLLRNKLFLIFTCLILSIVGLSLLKFYMMRYILFLIAPICILASYCLFMLLKRNLKLLPLTIVIIICITTLFAHKKEFDYDTELNFTHQVNVQQAATAYLEKEKLYNKLIFSNFPVYYGLRNPYAGYLSEDTFYTVARFNKNVEYGVIADPGNPNYTIPEETGLDLIKTFTSSYAKVDIYKVNRRK